MHIISMCLLGTKQEKCVLQAHNYSYVITFTFNSAQSCEQESIKGHTTWRDIPDVQLEK